MVTTQAQKKRVIALAKPVKAVARKTRTVLHVKRLERGGMKAVLEHAPSGQPLYAILQDRRRLIEIVRQSALKHGIELNDAQATRIADKLERRILRRVAKLDKYGGLGTKLLGQDPARTAQLARQLEEVAKTFKMKPEEFIARYNNDPAFRLEAELKLAQMGKNVAINEAAAAWIATNFSETRMLKAVATQPRLTATLLKQYAPQVSQYLLYMITVATAQLIAVLPGGQTVATAATFAQAGAKMTSTQTTATPVSRAPQQAAEESRKRVETPWIM